MSAHAYTISTSNITTTTASVVFTITADYSEAENVDLTVTSASGTVAYSNTVVIPASAVTGDEITTSLTGLRSNTTYTIDDDYSTPVTFTTLADNTAKTATQSQWEDLADRVGAKANAGDVPTITMTDVDPGEDSPLAANNFVAVYGGDPIIMDYSTAEINTGAKWIDGSAIYKKTIDFGALPNNTSKNVAHGISNLNKVIEMKGYTSNGTTFIPLPMTSTTGAPTAMNVDATNIIYTTSSDRTAYSETYVTLYYTKSS